MSIDSQADFRFALYMIPPYRVSRAVTEIHTVLRKQFGLIAADQFQVHATIKGFFKRVDGPLSPLITKLDAVFESQTAFPIHFCGYHVDDVAIGLNISCDGEFANRELMAVRKRVVDAVQPFIAPDCDFVASDLGPPFKAHITLAFRNILPSMQEDLLDYLREAPLPSEPFLAERFHFLEFHSREWSGHWERTLTWRLLKSWHLGNRRSMHLNKEGGVDYALTQSR